MKTLAITLVALPAIMLAVALAACKPIGDTVLPNAFSIGACLAQQPALTKIRLEDAHALATSIFLDLEAVSEKVQGGQVPTQHEIDSLVQAAEIAHAVGLCLPRPR